MSDFAYYNINPNRREEEDCVCRAISLASKLNYSAVDKLLCLIAEHRQCDKLCLNCYHYLLEEVFGYPVRYCDNSETVEDIASQYKNNVILVRIQGHLTCALYGVVFDLWNCSSELADCYWIVS